MAMYGIINEHARGTTISAPHEQAGKHTHKHARTFADICRHIHKHMVYVHVHACMDTHMCTHTQPDYFAYLLSKQSLLGSPLLTPAPIYKASLLGPGQSKVFVE